MNPHIKIRSTEVFNKSITKNDGKVKDLRMQRAIFDRGDGAAYPFDIMLSNQQAAYPAGNYSIAPESYLPDTFGVKLRLTCGELLKA